MSQALPGGRFDRVPREGPVRVPSVHLANV